MGIFGCVASFAAYGQFSPRPVYGQFPSHAAPPQRHIVASSRLPERNWYIGARFIQNFAFFTEDHSAIEDGDPVTPTSVNHSAAAQSGGSVFIGHRFDDNWRTELEVGYTGVYKDTTDGFYLHMSAPFASINATYNTVEQNWGWLYIGAGIGAAVPQIEERSLSNKRETASSISVMPSILAGWRFRAADAWFVDIGYRFSVYDAGSIQYDYEIDGIDGVFTNDIGWVMNHAVQIGLTFEF